MKYLILFLLSFNLHAALIRIEVFEGEKHIGGLVGENITRQMVAQKLAARGIDINDQKYRVLVTNVDQERAEREAKRASDETERQGLKVAVEQVTDPIAKAILRRLIIDLYGE